MILRRGGPVALFAHEMDFAIMKTFETRPVSGMDHHRVGQKIAHVLHHSELAELVERRRRLIHDEDVGRMDQHASKGKTLLFAAGQERAPLVCFVEARNEMFKAAAHENVPHFLVRNLLLGVGIEQARRATYQAENTGVAA